MLNISNFDTFVFTRILRLKSQCNKIDATKKTLFRLRNAFFVVDVILKFSKNFSFFDIFNILVKETTMLLNLKRWFSYPPFDYSYSPHMTTRTPPLYVVRGASGHSVRITLLATYRVTHRSHKRIIDIVK